ncbi:hypothetical protein MCC93_01110 [Morococcus cerebrosus]|uniref:Uncharacterized protein n=1 Tax=Morococcus cerebrosus TaxID=1056807 RepID=A0A0C1H469_9NEIS|nr:hypothetical protein MCC93_01110 [Morococcus cerebrosus]
MLRFLGLSGGIVTGIRQYGQDGRQGRLKPPILLLDDL